MARIINTKNGRIATIISEDATKCKTVMVQFEDTGKTEEYSSSTIKRWWKKIEETSEHEETVNDISNAIMADVETQEAAEEVAGDGTSYSQVMNEILADEKKAADEKNSKKAAKKAKAKKRIQNEQVPDILAYIDEQANEVGLEFYVRDKQPELFNYRAPEGKVLFVVRKVYDRVEIWLKSKSLDKSLADKLEAAKGFYDKKLVLVELGDKSKKLIDSIIANYDKEEV